MVTANFSVFQRKSRPFKDEPRRPKETEYEEKFDYTPANANNEKKKIF